MGRARSVFPARPGARDVVVVEVERIADSCGYAVPLHDYARDRGPIRPVGSAQGRGRHDRLPCPAQQQEHRRLPAPRCSISTPTRSSASSPTPAADNRVAGRPGRRCLAPMVRNGAAGAREGRAHPSVRLIEAFYRAQAAFYDGGDDTAALRACWQMTLPGTCPGAAPSPVTTTAIRKSWAISPPAWPTPRRPFGCCQAPSWPTTSRRCSWPTPAGARRPAADLADRRGVPHRRRQDRAVLAGAFDQCLFD